MTIRQLIEELERMEKAYGPHVKVHASANCETIPVDGVIYENQRVIIETN